MWPKWGWKTYIAILVALSAMGAFYNYNLISLLTRSDFNPAILPSFMVNNTEKEVKTVFEAVPSNLTLGDLKGRRLFVFGDSTVDAGNFNITKLPYGVDNPSPLRLQPRFTNGLTIADYLALKLQTHIPQAFNTLGLKQPGEDVNINFASGGCGLLDETHPILCSSFGHQVAPFLTSTLKDKQIERSLFFISVGANDFIFSFRKLEAQESSTKFAAKVVSTLQMYMKLLYSSGGARIFLVNTLAPIGCIPDKRDRTTNMCDQVLNQGASEFNKQPEKTLWTFKQQHDVLIFLGDSRKMYSQIRNSPLDFGFTDIYRPCCGIWNANTSRFECEGDTPYCSSSSRHEYFFFDGAHPTDEANRVFVEGCLAGRLCYPIHAPATA